ncbi:MAG: hypothetical protein ACI4J7_10385 [Ruminiclostridium sp.]
MGKYMTLFFDMCSGFIYIIQLAIIVCSSLAMLVMPFIGVYRTIKKKYWSGISLLVLWVCIIISLIISKLFEITMVVGIAGLLLVMPFFGVYKLIKKKRVLGISVIAVWFAAVAALITAYILR